MQKLKASYAVVAVLFVSSLLLSFNLVQATVNTDAVNTTSQVNSIILSGEGANIKWTTDGYSAQGFKIVWSKNANPVYPSRDGDQYHYYTEPAKNSDTLEAFAGNGDYYIRVCEYLGGQCGVYSNQISLTLSDGTKTAIVPTCADTDDGDAPFVSGKIYGNNSNGESYKYYDECVNDKQVRERYCQKYDDGRLLPGDKILDCANGCREGACLKEAIVCTMEENPVCGVDGQTYANECVAVKQKGVKVSYKGACDSGKEDCAIQCLRYDPVCGQDGKNYSCGKADAICHGVAAAYPGECKKAAVEKYKYKYSNWACYDGTSQENNDPTSCKPLELWKKYAADFCANKCNDSGEKCGVNSFAVDNICGGAEEIAAINKKAELLNNNQLGEILKELNELRSLVKEQQTQIKYLKSLLEDLGKLTEAMQNSINSFITYGVDDNTKKLGEGERAAVMHSYKAAYGKLPEDKNEFADAIKIANGRWPSEKSGTAEEKAKLNFAKIYNRAPNTDDAKDNAAVTIMAYGLRQKAENRNLQSEENGMKIFDDILNHVPQTTEEWNIMQAITYSGATR